MTPLKIYFDLEACAAEYSANNHIAKHLLKKENRFGVLDNFELTAPEEAEVFFYPRLWRYCRENPGFEAFKAHAKQLGKRVVVLGYDDFYNPDGLDEDTIAFHATVSGAERKANDYPNIPIFWDLVERYNGGDVLLREYESVPTVGFCGNALYSQTPPAGLMKRLRWMYDKFCFEIAGNPRANGFFRALVKLLKKPMKRFRAEVILPIQKSERIRSRFIFRNKCNNGVRFDGSKNDDALLEQSKRDYYENVVGSDYTLCPRGAGNFSLRFYETFSMGRIPVFVNTDCVLPFSDEIDYKSQCVWIEHEELGQIEEKILEFHARLTPDRFRELQLKNRQIFLDYFQPRAFFEHIIGIIRKEIG